MSIKIPYRTIENFICAIAGILSMNPYFIWPTFMNGIFAYAAYGIYILSSILMIRRGARLRKSNLTGVVLLCAIFLLTYLNTFSGVGITTVLGGASIFFYLISFVCLNPEDKSEIFRLFVKVFIVTLIPGLIYYVLELLGISLSIGTIYSQNQMNYAQSVEYLTTRSTGYYKLYIGAVLRVNANTRFSGIYDESGLVGTVAALCLAANRMNFKDKWSRWLLLFVIISFSLAGYFLVIIYYIMASIRKKQWKLPIVLILILLGGNLLLTIKTSNELINKLQSRIQLSGTSIAIKNNRETSHFNVGYAQLLNGNLKEKMFGFGRGAATENVYMNGSSSYKCYIFNYGYLGFGIMIATIIFLYKKYLYKIWELHWSEFVLITLFMMSIYQRPAIYFPYYFIVLYGGSAFLSRKENVIVSK